MPTKQQLEEGIRRAHAAGDAKAVQVLGGQLRLLNQEKPKPSFWSKIASTAKDAGQALDTAIIGLPEGMYNAAAFVTDPIAKKAISLFQGEEAAEAVMRKEQKRRREYSATARRLANLGQTPKDMPIARDIGQATGGLALPLPGKKLQQGTKYAKAAYRAMQGAVGGAAITEPGDDLAGNVAVGSAANVVLPPALGMVAKPIVSGVSKGARYLTGLAKPPIVEPIETLGEEAAQRIARFKALGVEKPTTGMITRDPKAFGFEEFSKQAPQGRALHEQIGDVHRSLLAKGQELIQSQGGAKGAEATGVTSQKFLESKQHEMRELTTKLYNEVRDTRGTEVVGRLNSLRETMTHPDVVDNAAFDAMREGLIRRMTRLGLVSKSGGLSKPINLNQAEELRKFIGGLGNGSEAKIRMMRAKLIDALDDDVVEVIGDDAFKAARSSAKAGFEEFKKTVAGKIVDEAIPPEKLVKHIFGETTSLEDIRSLRKTYLTGTKEQIAQGAEAWQQVKAQALDDLLTMPEQAEGKLNGKKLLDNFTRQAPKFREIFSPKEFNELQNLIIASRDASVFPTGITGKGAADMTELFQALPQKLQGRWARFLDILKTSGMHSLAFMSGGPGANVALGVGQQTVSSAAQKSAANYFIKQIEMASSPEKAAAAIAAAKTVAKTNPLINDFLQKRGIVGSAAAAVQGDR